MAYIGLKSLPYTKTLMILLDQNEHLKGGGVDVIIDFVNVY